MDELHEREQYFWDDATLVDLADRLQQFVRPCCLCAPLLGRELLRRGIACRILDSDERFDSLAGWEHFDLNRPIWRAEEFDVIVCDPPFWSVSLSQLWGAINVLSHYNWRQPLAICYPTRRVDKLCSVFARFDLQPRGVFPTYRSVQMRESDRIQFCANFEW